MPAYDYQCLKCDKPFSLTMTIAERESRKIRCPRCRSIRVRQILTSFFAQTAKKS
jgi:putative FmdB family regulatory protein